MIRFACFLLIFLFSPLIYKFLNGGLVRNIFEFVILPSEDYKPYGEDGKYHKSDFQNLGRFCQNVIIIDDSKKRFAKMHSSRGSKRLYTKEDGTRDDASEYGLDASGMSVVHFYGNIYSVEQCLS